MKAKDPFYPNQPERAFVVLQGHPVGVGSVVRGFAGYSMVYDYSAQVATIGYKACEDAAKEVVNKYNNALGITPAQAMAAKLGSMCGWAVPGANPAKWENLNAAF